MRAGKLRHVHSFPFSAGAVAVDSYLDFTSRLPEILSFS